MHRITETDPDIIYAEWKKDLKKTYYLNSNFDLELGNIPLERYEKFADEMTCLFLSAVDARDSVVVNITPHKFYYEYLKQIGIEYASIAGDSDIEREGLAWGMNSKSLNILESYNCICDFPDETIVKKINSRKYSNDICRKLNYPHGKCADNYEELLDIAAKSSFPFVAKTEFGSSASGFIHVKKSEDIKKLNKGLNYFNFGISFIIEPWRERVEDYSAGFFLSKNGEMTDFNVRKLFSTDRGQFDALITGLEIDEKLFNEMHDAAIKISESLVSEGYFGHVSFDAYTFRDGEGISMNPVSEINARMTMADIARFMAEKTSSRISSIKFVKGKHLERFKCESDIISCFGDEAYSAERGKGIILMSPLYYEKNGLKHLTERALFCALSDTEKEAQIFLNKISSLEWHRC
ncbi:MAG TPA: hypothetical protein PK624_05440 [Spirochaetota bacterium]|nr:hypothetical protein [Spirochaetota bacterium]HOR44221.1 hypothetical protein [Spirochaetota bacterium]HPK55667.1 hypothetical protein [Spirochaetota bacterium]